MIRNIMIEAEDYKSKIELTGSKHKYNFNRFLVDYMNNSKLNLLFCDNKSKIILDSIFRTISGDKDNSFKLLFNYYNSKVTINYLYNESIFNIKFNISNGFIIDEYISDSYNDIHIDNINLIIKIFDNGNLKEEYKIDKYEDRYEKLNEININTTNIIDGFINFINSLKVVNEDDIHKNYMNNKDMLYDINFLDKYFNNETKNILIMPFFKEMHYRMLNSFSQELLDYILEDNIDQILIISSNDNFVTNDYFRPDIINLIEYDRYIKSSRMDKSIDKELRKAHNLRKMLISGAFYN